jgi:hypothetical protein
MDSRALLIGLPLLLLACGNEDGSTATRCRLESTAPAFDDTGVPIAGSLSIKWTVPVDPATVPAQIQFKELGGAVIPIAVQMAGDREALVNPAESRWFWGAYALTVGEGVASLDGDACVGEDIAFSTVVPETAPTPLRSAGAWGMAKVGDTMITVSPTYRGLQVYDVADPSDVHLIGDVKTDTMPVAIVTSGDRAYVPVGHEGVLIFDISDPATPILAGRAGTPGYANDAAPFEQNGSLYLAVADMAEGVRLLDVTDPRGPLDLGVIDPSHAHESTVFAVDIQGDLLAIAEGKRGLSLVSIASLIEPVVLSTLADPDERPFVDVVLAGDLAYVSQDQFGVRSYGIADKAAPVALDQIVGPSGDCPGLCPDFIKSLRVSNGELYVATGIVGALRVSLDAIGGMAVASTIDVPGQAFSLVVDDTHLFVGTEDGLLTYPRSAPTGAAPLWSNPDSHGLVRAVAVLGDHAYAATGSRGLQTFSLADPAAPLLLDRDGTPGLDLDYSALSVIAAPGLVILGDGRAGITLFDASDPDQPVAVSSIAANDAIAGLELSGDTLYVCDTNKGMFIADIGVPSAPVILSRPAFPPDDVACLDFELVGDLLYVAGSYGLGIVDVADPAAPAWLGWVDVPLTEIFSSIEVVGTHLFATSSVIDYEGTFGATHRLHVFDLRDPLSPVRVWEGEDLGGAGDIEVAGDTAFIAGGSEGVFVWDIGDPTDPRLQGAITTSGNAHGLALSAETLHVAALSGGLMSIPLKQLPPH